MVFNSPQLNVTQSKATGRREGTACVGAVAGFISSEAFLDVLLRTRPVFLWHAEEVHPGCFSSNGACVSFLCLQMRTAGVPSKGTALKRCWTGPPRGKTSPSSRTATSLGTSSLLVSEAGRQGGGGAPPSRSLILTILPRVSVFQPSSWASRCSVTGRTSPSPFEWTGETPASLRKTWCSRGLA